MKKTIVFVSVLIVLLSLFAACADKNETDGTKKQKNQTDKSSASVSEENTFNSDSEFELDDEKETTVLVNGNDKQILHRDKNGYYIMLDHCDSDGNVIYYEEPVYESDGNIKGYNYYDVNKKQFASTDSKNKFYNADGIEITENEFVVLLQKAEKIKKEK